PRVAVARLLPPRATLFPYTTLFRSELHRDVMDVSLLGTLVDGDDVLMLEPHPRFAFAVKQGHGIGVARPPLAEHLDADRTPVGEDRKSTRLNSSHVKISYAVFCLKK